MDKTRVLGRGCDLLGVAEDKFLMPGLDFRLPQYRREVFLRFYGFHLRHRAHPGGVYYLIPGLGDYLGWGAEERLWFTFINGCCQHPVTSYLIWRRFPVLAGLDEAALSAWFREHYTRLGWDTDRRYVKNKFEQCVAGYRALLAGRPQLDYWAGLLDAADEGAAFQQAWRVVMDDFPFFGRLSTFSYLEYQRIAGLPLNCNSLFLDDIKGSKSHRNGLCKVLGRDDLDWHESNPAFDGDYSPEIVAWLTEEGETLLAEAQARYAGEAWARDVNYFTLESTLCCYKSWHRPRRRYPNVYNDMLHDRICKAEEAWAGAMDFSLFWDIRREALPLRLRLEDTPADLGLHPTKQDHYRLTGQVIMMDGDDPVFANDYNEYVRAASSTRAREE